MLIAKLFWAPCLGEPPFGFPFHLFRLLSVNLSPICSVFVSNLIVIWKREGRPHLVSPLLVRCVFVATNLLDQMPRMEGKHHCASPLLFPSYISNFEQLEKERAVTIVWVFFWSDGDRSYTNENHFSALLSVSYFSKFEHLNIFASIKSNMDCSAVTSVSQIGRWGHSASGNQHPDNGGDIIAVFT